MVKPLNKEWALFGRKYRIPGAKGEKVDCNACQKQVSAAVNRLQSHLRVCPARPLVVASVEATTPDPHSPDAVTLEGLTPTASTTDGGPPLKRPRPTSLSFLHREEFPMTTRRLEIEEQRLALECERVRCEQQRIKYELEILASKARKERLVADKEAYEARVLLALSRKQLRDQGVDEQEIDRVLPIEPLEEATTSAMETAETVTATDAPTDTVETEPSVPTLETTTTAQAV